MFPENTHTPPTEIFLFDLAPPPPISSFGSYFTSKNLAFETPTPNLEFLITLLEVGMDIFWNHTMDNDNDARYY